MKRERKNESIAVCKEISIKDEITIYYEISEDMMKMFIPDTYLFREESTEESSTISAIYVDRIISDAKDIEGIIKVNKNLLFRKIDNEYIFPMEEEIVQEYKNADTKQFKKLLKQTLLDLGFLIRECRYFYDDQRQKYLIDTYFVNPKEFEKHSSKDKHKWSLKSKKEEPKIAFVRDGEVQMQAITNELLDDMII